MKHPDEDNLALLVKAGDESAFTSLFSYYHGAILSFAARQFPSLDPSELAQETWINAWKKRDSYSPDYRFGTWLFTIARRRGVDQIRRLDVYDRAKDRFETAHRIIEPIIRVDDNVPASDLQKLVADCMADLPPLQARVMRLVADGFSQSEIAKMTKTPLGTVKTRYELGCKAVKKALAHRDYSRDKK